MENKLLNITNDKELRITSIELVDIINDFRKLESESIGKEYVKLRHDNFLTKIEKEVEVLNSLCLNADLNFKEGKYLDKNNQPRPCYELNRDGMLQMLNSESTIVRYKTIEYINKLEYENQKLKQEQQLTLANEKIEKLEAIVNKFERLTEEAKLQYKPSHKMKLDYSKLIRALTNDDEEYDIVKQWVFANLGYTKWEDACIDDKKKIIDTINTVARLLTIKKMEQLSLF
jgi:phage regulator Rha-like protein